MNRKQQQLALISDVGMVLGPIEALIANPEVYTAEDRSHVRAVFLPEWQRLGNNLNTFSKPAGADYRVELRPVEALMMNISTMVESRELIEDPTLIAQKMPAYKQQLLDAIAAIPARVIEITGGAGSAFSVYCRIKELCETARNKIVYVDRYVDDVTLYRYFEHVQPSVQITIVTWPESKFGKNVDALAAYHRFIAVSRLCAIQRPNTYTLVEYPAIHSRRLLIDDQLFELSDSLKSAAMGTAFRLSRDRSPASRDALSEETGVKAKELFGSNVKKHP